MTCYHCSNCHRPYPESEFAYRCQQCGGVFAVNGDLSYHPDKLAYNLPGIWRYQHTFGLPLGAPVVSLGEGNTPLVPVHVFGQPAFFKLEYLNPSGSFKDRGTSPLVSLLVSHQVTEAVEDSSGNAGASFATYAARAGVKARVYVPDYAAGPKREQIEAHGADVVRILGSRSATAKAVKRAADEQGVPYASHAYLPYGLAGIATIAYELVEQLGNAPGTVIAPVGHGSLLLGVAMGFAALREAGVISDIPTLVGVQVYACAPIWAVASMGPAGLGWVTEGETVAEGVRVRTPLRGDALLQFLGTHGGQMTVVEEERILVGRDQLARLGFYVEPTSAIVMDALEQVVGKTPEPIVVILTGSGLKSKLI